MDCTSTLVSLEAVQLSPEASLQIESWLLDCGENLPSKLTFTYLACDWWYECDEDTTSH